MKLKTVPKIRADCISCNGDSSVRIREGSKKVVGPVKQPAVATGFKRNHWSDEFALPHVDVIVDSEDTAEVELLRYGCRREKSLEIMQGQGFLCVAIKKSFRRSVFPYIRYSSCFWTGIRNYITT